MPDDLWDNVNKIRSAKGLADNGEPTPKRAPAPKRPPETTTEAAERPAERPAVGPVAVAPSIGARLRELAAQEKEEARGTPEDHDFNELMSREIIIFLLSESRASPARDWVINHIHHLRTGHLTGNPERIVLLAVQELLNETDELPPSRFIKNAIRESIRTEEVFQSYAGEVEALINAAESTRGFVDGRAAAVVLKSLIPFIQRGIRTEAMNNLIIANGKGQYEVADQIWDQMILDLNFDESNETQDLWHNIDDTITEEAVDHIKLPGTQLCAILNCGGPPRGETLLLQQGTGKGKTTWCCNQASYTGYRHRYNTLYITLECSAKEIKQRCLAITTGIPLLELSSHDGRLYQEAKEQIGPDGNSSVRVIHLEPYKYTMVKLRAILKQLRIKYRWEPVVVIVDYLAKLQPMRRYKEQEEHNRLAAIAQDFCRFCRHENVLGITVAQANREAEKGKTTGRSTIQGSYEMLGPIGYVLALDQSPGERKGEVDPEVFPPNKVSKYDVNFAYCRLIVDKNRGPGGDGQQIPMQFNKLTYKLREI